VTMRTVRRSTASCGWRMAARPRGRREQAVANLTSGGGRRTPLEFASRECARIRAWSASEAMAALLHRTVRRADSARGRLRSALGLSRVMRTRLRCRERGCWQAECGAIVLRAASMLETGLDPNERMQLGQLEDQRSRRGPAARGGQPGNGSDMARLLLAHGAIRTPRCSRGLGHRCGLHRGSPRTHAPTRP